MLQLATFELDSLRFGLDVRVVQEVLADQELTPVPQAPAAVRGLVNLRGQILVAIDLRTVLGRSQRLVDDVATERHRGRRIVILQTPHEPVALLVDAFGDVVEAEDDAFDACETLLDEDTAALIVGVYRRDAGLLHLLDADALSQRIFAVTRRRK